MLCYLFVFIHFIFQKLLFTLILQDFCLTATDLLHSFSFFNNFLQRLSFGFSTILFRKWRKCFHVNHRQNQSTSFGGQVQLLSKICISSDQSFGSFPNCSGYPRGGVHGAAAFDIFHAVTDYCCCCCCYYGPKLQNPTTKIGGGGASSQGVMYIGE